jgi:hypothetical protein
MRVALRGWSAVQYARPATKGALQPGKQQDRGGRVSGSGSSYSSSSKKSKKFKELVMMQLRYLYNLLRL